MTEAHDMSDAHTGSVEPGTLQRRRVFVIMPFTTSPTRDQTALTAFFENNIRGPIEALKRADRRYIVTRSDISFNITEQIIHDIYSADIVVADLSGVEPNANVMYELGVRFSVSDGPVILIRESHSDNRRIFDVDHFHIQSYSTVNYGPLTEHIVAKIRAFEGGSEVFRSPVLKALSRRPEIAREVERHLLLRRIVALQSALRGLMRLLGGAIGAHLTEEFAADFPENVGDLTNWLLKHKRATDDISWDGFRFTPLTPPALYSYLTDLPLVVFGDDEVTRQFNTLVMEYYIRFFSLRSMWEPTSQDQVVGFLYETEIICQALTLLAVLVTDNTSDPGRICKVILATLAKSHMLGEFAPGERGP